MHMKYKNCIVKISLLNKYVLTIIGATIGYGTSKLSTLCTCIKNQKLM